MEDRSKSLFLLLLIGSLCLNFYTLSRINELTGDTQDMRNQVGQLQGHISSEISTIRDSVNAMMMEDRWMSPVDITLGEPSGTFIPATLTWQLKECPVDSMVSLYMKGPGETEFTSYPTDRAGGGGFKAQVTYDIQPDPIVSILVTKEGESKSRVESSGTYAIDSYEYYVTMSDGKQLRTSEMSSLSIPKISGTVVAPIMVEISVKKDSPAYTIAVHETPKPEPYYCGLQGVSLKVISSDDVPQVTRLDAARTVSGETVKGRVEVPVYEANIENKSPGMSEVFLVLDYGDGRVAEIPVKPLMDPDLMF